MSELTEYDREHGWYEREGCGCYAHRNWKHDLVHVDSGPIHACVDVGIAPFITVLGSKGIETIMSCQGKAQFGYRPLVVVDPANAHLLWGLASPIGMRQAHHIADREAPVEFDEWIGSASWHPKDGALVDFWIPQADVDRMVEEWS